ncbi:galactokinase [Thermosipho ferrireducens]|uniref:Galactokinase n=1 Tax=Thermosipho ferrireducens TaxID=2571116 RepID=A0ABX7S8D1_9BACT|nr:galactokinase [Thermosipho ferrireducens]QTA38859.1 galactokinase [Thermosipho ferrireducens]
MKVRAPGRVNIIGEHTDYNGGFVLPFAINKYVNVEVKASNLYRFISKNMEPTVETKKLTRTNTWADYIIGILNIISETYKIDFVEFVISSDLPAGAGLSSSAALEVATAYAISKLFSLNLTKKEIALIAYRAENEFVGTKCGIMDQYTVALSKKDHALFIDTQIKNYKYIPLQINPYRFYIINSGIKHKLSNSEYNRRREECETALKILKKANFREITFNDLKKLQGIYKKRVQHVLEENDRVLKTINALKAGKSLEIGKYLYDSHKSLKELYEVSCEEIDFIVEYLKQEKIPGARIIGGGFGGSVLVLAGENFPKIFSKLKTVYETRYPYKISLLNITSSNGVEIVGK